MKKNFKGFAAVAMFILLAYVAGLKGQAVTPATPYSFSVTGTLANCPAIASGTTQYCFTTAGEYQSINGGTYSIVGGAAANPNLTINGTTKPLPGPFTIAVAAPTVSATATSPTVSATSTAPSVTVN